MCVCVCVRLNRGSPIPASQVPAKNNSSGVTAKNGSGKDAADGADEVSWTAVRGRRVPVGSRSPAQHGVSAAKK